MDSVSGEPLAIISYTRICPFYRTLLKMQTWVSSASLLEPSNSGRCVMRCFEGNWVPLFSCVSCMRFCSWALLRAQAKNLLRNPPLKRESITPISNRSSWKHECRMRLLLMPDSGSHLIFKLYGFWLFWINFILDSNIIGYKPSSSRSWSSTQPPMKICLPRQPLQPLRAAEF